ncbi:MAG: hypothetical protein AB7Q29_05255 [Vicinamibacterales bacterium]
MQCRKCGTEIADKALICYRCGTATTEAKYQPYVKPSRRRGSPLLWIIVAVVALVLLTLFLLNSPNTQVP